MATRSKPKLSHVTSNGSANMVDVSEKKVTDRVAIASGSIQINKKAISLIRKGKTTKGNIFETAKLAGILAAKRTAELIPLCHSLPVNHISIDIYEINHGFEVKSEIRAQSRTGLEMEALTSVSVSLLTLYDMVKAVDKTMVISDITLRYKRGGNSGEYTREEENL